MLEVGFEEGVAEGLEAEMLVEGDGRELGVQLQGGGTLALGLGDELLAIFAVAKYFIWFFARFAFDVLNGIV